jgi:outer membrane lipoprotein-sorting protein
MLSQKISLVIAGTVIIAAAGAFIWQSQSGSNVIPGLSNKNSSQMYQNISFSQLMQMGGNYTCTFTDSSDEGTVNGTTYIAASENKFRTDYNIDRENLVAQTESESDIAFNFQNGSIISDGEFVYIWSPETNQGMKMAFDPNDSNFLDNFDRQDEEGNKTIQTFDQDQAMEYNCKPWKVENSKFIPPAEVTFVDFSAQFEQIKSMMNTMQPEGNVENNTSASTQTEAGLDMSEMCTFCTQLPAGEARTECLAAFGC